MVVGEVTDADPELVAPDEPGVDDADSNPDTEPDPEIADKDPEASVAEVDTEFEPGPADDDAEEDAPELGLPSPGSSEKDGPLVKVTVGNMVVVITVLVMIVVGPLKMIVFPLPKMSICVAIEM